MKIATKRSLRFTLALALIFSVVLPIVRHAPAQAASGGITVTPAYVNVNLLPKMDSQDAAVGVRNDFNVPVQLYSEMSGLTQKGRLLIPSGAPDKALVAATELTPSEFTLGPKQSVNIKLHITNSEALTPGTHAAALQIKQLAQGGSKLTIQTGVAVAVFVTKRGGEVQRVTIDSVTTPTTLFSLPGYADVTVRNTGNTLLLPRGTVALYDRQGTQVAKGIINQESAPLLDGNSLTLRVPMQSLSHAWWPGRYRLETLVRFDGTDNYVASRSQIWYIPPWLAWSIVAGLLLVALVVWQRKRLGRIVRKKPSKPQSSFKETPPSSQQASKKRHKITIKSDDQ